MGRQIECENIVFRLPIEATDTMLLVVGDFCRSNIKCLDVNLLMIEGGFCVKRKLCENKEVVRVIFPDLLDLVFSNVTSVWLKARWNVGERINGFDGRRRINEILLVGKELDEGVVDSDDQPDRRFPYGRDAECAPEKDQRRGKEREPSSKRYVR